MTRFYFLLLIVLLGCNQPDAPPLTPVAFEPPAAVQPDAKTEKAMSDLEFKFMEFDLRLKGLADTQEQVASTVEKLATRITLLEAKPEAQPVVPDEPQEPPPGLLPQKLANFPCITAYTAKWCAPCKQMHEAWDRLAKDFRLDIVDVDDPPAWAKDTDLPKSLPCTIAWGDKETQLGRWDGAVEEETIRKAIAKVSEASYIPGYLGPVLQSPVDMTLQQFAQSHSAEQARYQRQGHDVGTSWDVRYQQLRAMLGKHSYQEICAESWPEQVNQSSELLWAEMFRCWKLSPDHWSVAGVRHAAYGAGMAKGRNDIWYATIITKN